MAHTPETLAARLALNARMKNLPYSKRVKLTEALRAIHNDGMAAQAENARKANMPPAQPNAMSDAVTQRLTPEPASKPRSMTEIKAMTPRPKQTTIREIPAMAEKISKEKAEKEAARQFTANYNREHFSRPNFPPTESPAMYRTENLAERIGGRVAAGADYAVEKAIPMMQKAGSLAGRMGGKAVPVLGDLVLPYAAINGGEMYPQSEDGIYTSAVGGPLPPQYQQANEQEMQRREQIGQLQQQQQSQRNQILYGTPQQLQPVPPRTNIASNLTTPQRDPFVPLEMQQQPAEPQSFAQQFAQEPAPQQEPQSFAKQFAQEPSREFDHYVKILGTPEKARQALANRYQVQQPSY